jgi:hypothetical protein
MFPRLEQDSVFDTNHTSVDEFPLYRPEIRHPLKTSVIITVLGLLMCSQLSAQMCPGGAVNFDSGAVTFDPAWIYGCNTGTSCNGGVNFDNRASCQPTTAMDACAPPPTCAIPANNGSNIWFKFYAAASSVTISCFQNTSFTIAVQAFSGGPTCGSLTQIGCATAAGPSSGVNLTLNGLTIGQLYYYRVFGSAAPVSQRTGLYCFCGTVGVQNYVLADGLNGFTGKADNESVTLNWEFVPGRMPSEFNVEFSSDQRMFNTISTVRSVPGKGQYAFTFDPNDDHDLFYRIRYMNESGVVVYSPVLKITAKGISSRGTFTILNSSRQLRINVAQPTSFILCNSAGTVLRSYSFSAGVHMVSAANLAAGVYFMKNINSNKVQKLAIF